MNRRELLRNGVAGIGLLAVSGCSLGPLLRSPHNPRVLFSAAQSATGDYVLIAMEPDGSILYRKPLPARFHGGCAQPDGRWTLFFARRPGDVFFVLDTLSGDLVHEVRATNGRKFYGHGTFDPSGQWLYATENDYDNSRGVIGVYDARQNFKRVGEFEAGGIGPHEIRLHPDGTTLVVAVGGIDTHPDSGRIKLNLDSMESSLALIDRRTGRLIEAYPSPHPLLSCRHIDVSAEGVVVAGFQYEGAEWEDQPLLARLDTRSRQWHVIDLPIALQRELKQYIASVAINNNTGTALVTAPRGGKLLLLDLHSAQPLGLYDMVDAAGVVASDDGFIVSNGLGAIRAVSVGSDMDVAHQDRLVAGIHWDNHMLLSGS